MNPDATTDPPVIRTRPGVVDAGTLLVLAAAAVNVAIGIAVAVTAAAVKAPVPAGLIAAVVAISVVYALVIAVLALLFRAGRFWARPALATAAAVNLFTLFSPNALNLAVTLLLLVAVILLYRTSVSFWVRSIRGLARG